MPRETRPYDELVRVTTLKHRRIEHPSDTTEGRSRTIPHIPRENARLPAANSRLMKAVRGPYREHDLLVRSLALHCHFAAIHPFLDGNGRTARAVEALMLQRAGLRDALFLATPNSSYDEKDAYLAAPAEVRKQQHDLTACLIFGLRGAAVQCRRLSDEIRTRVSKSLFRDAGHSGRSESIGAKNFPILPFIEQSRSCVAPRPAPTGRSEGGIRQAGSTKGMVD